MHTMTKKDFLAYRLPAKNSGIHTITLTFEFTSGGICFLAQNDTKLPFKAGGGGYDKPSSVMADFFNEYFDGKRLFKRESVKGVYGHTGGFLSYGVGLSCHESLFKKLRGFNLEYITETKTALVYRFTFDSAFLKVGVIKL